MGILIVAMLWLVNKPFGASGGYTDLVHWLQKPSRSPNWRLAFLVGMIGGGALFALTTGTFHPTWDQAGFDQVWSLPLWGKGLLLTGAGALIGFGVRLSGGCTSGHGLCGISYGSLDSVVATLTFMGTAVAAANVTKWLLAGGLH
jgi:uncharacterized membrane protein YedE/YeeE